MFTSFFNSPTFWSEVILRAFFVAFLLFCLAVVLRIFWNRNCERRVNDGLIKGDAGTTMMLEFTLLAPIILIFFIVLGQAIMLMRTAMVVHYSAYAAARSARVHMPSANGLVNKMGGAGGAALAKADSLLSKRPVSADYQKIAETAARKILIAASPVNQKLECIGTCDVPSFLGQVNFKDNLGDTGLNKAMQTRAKYAFDVYSDGAAEGNVTVRVIFGEMSSNNLGQTSNLTGTDIAIIEGKNADGDLAYPVTASVEFRAYLIAPYFRNICLRKNYCLFGVKQIPGKNRYYVPIKAEVTVY